jgi:alpha-tubulin suppressor-like RCC1 family protein
MRKAILLALALCAGCQCGDNVKRTRPAIGAEPADLDFGVLALGQSLEKPLVIHNTGSAALNVKSLTLKDDPNAAFDFTPSKLPAILGGGTATLKVTYTTKQVGRDLAHLVVESDAENTASLSVALSGLTDPARPDAGPADGGADAGPPAWTAAQVEVGGLSTFALTTDGGVKGWGDNSVGELGDGTQTNRNVPVDTAGLPSAAIRVAAGSFHACAALAAGGVRCWGENQNGELGNGAPSAAHSQPQAVVGLAGAVSGLSAGSAHTCALLSGGSVVCWGQNDRGQVGDGTSGNVRPQATPVTLGQPAAAVTAGASHSCALLQDATVKCWGDNYYGQLGTGTAMDEFDSPTPVLGLAAGVKAVAAGSSHTCVLTSGDGVQCFGHNASGELGDGSTNDSVTPRDASGLASGVLSIVGGGEHTCAIRSDQSLECWGKNDRGQLGDGSQANRSTPTAVFGSLKARSASGRLTHTCAILLDGTPACWGFNHWGELGNGSDVDSATPVPVTVK